MKKELEQIKKEIEKSGYFAKTFEVFEHSFEPTKNKRLFKAIKTLKEQGFEVKEKFICVRDGYSVLDAKTALVRFRVSKGDA